MNLTKAATFVGVSPRTLRLAVDRGEIEAEHPLSDGPWIFRKRVLESEAAIQFAQRPHCEIQQEYRYPAEAAIASRHPRPGLVHHSDRGALQQSLPPLSQPRLFPSTSRTHGEGSR
jgi:hypothetical protein